MDSPFKNSDDKRWLLAGFLVKVLLGLIYGYVFLHFYNGDDTWKLFRSSLLETDLLLNKPGQFFSNEFSPHNALVTGKTIVEVLGVYFDDLQYVLLVKTMAVFNLVTGGNYYVNVVLLNAIFFFGHYWLYRLMTELFPEKKALYLILLFLFLPAVFWLSGIRVDGMLFFFTGMYLFHLFTKTKHGAARLVPVIIGFVGVFICRPEIAILLIPVTVAWYLAERTGKILLAFSGVYLTGIVLFFLPGLNISAYVAQKQHAFLMLKGTKFGIGSLDASPASYIRSFPRAAANIFFRPLPWEAEGVLQFLASAEIAAFWIIIVACVVLRHPSWKNRLQTPALLAILILGMSTYIFISYIVAFPGAYVRYKAIPELLILSSLVSISRWKGDKY